MGFENVEEFTAPKITRKEKKNTMPKGKTTGEKTTSKKPEEEQATRPTVGVKRKPAKADKGKSSTLQDRRESRKACSAQISWEALKIQQG